MSITFSIPGNPVPQPRTKVCVRNNKPHGYVEKKHPIHAYRQAVAFAAREAGVRQATGPVSIIIDAVFARPKSHMNKSGVKPKAPALPRPDVDNISKGVLDALKSVMGDDSNVGRLLVEKTWGTEGRTTVRIS